MTTIIPNPERADDENPEWTDEMFAQAKLTSEFPELQALVKANSGSPNVENSKKTIRIRLSHETLAYFKATGKGWQTRIDDILTKYATSH